MVQRYQTINIDGFIHDTGTVHDGDYNGPIEINPRFLLFEHTDKLNYINLELRRMDELVNFKWASINLTAGLTEGAVVPRTDADLLNYPENDMYHLSGYGVGMLGGVNFTFFDHFFIQSEFKGGFIDLPSLRTTPIEFRQGASKFLFRAV